MRPFSLFLTALIIAAGTIGCTKKAPKPEEAVTIDSTKLAAFKPLPVDMPSDSNPISPEKAELGRMLYFEKRLSKSQQFSCNSCHNLTTYGVDNQPVSTGHNEQKGNRNSPTVYNAAGQIAQFWDGRAASVEEQAKGPILNPVEMAMPDSATVIKTLKSIPGYEEAFAKAFPGEKDPITYNNLGKAIGAFERKLVTPSRWDQFLKGDKTALTDEEKSGFNTFVDAGCSSCHSGQYLGGKMFQKLGLAKEWHITADSGRVKVTKQEPDKFVFKVASLRNISQTGPYFHDGSIDSLHKAVSSMGDVQLNKKLSSQEVQAIVAFLKTLTGQIPAEYIQEPKLPENGPKTPQPKS